MIRVPHQSLFVVLLALLGAGLAGLYLTSGQSDSALRGNVAQRNRLAQYRVDQSALITAQTMSNIDTAPADRFFALEALRLADQEVDVAFASALRNAASAAAPVTPETRQLQTRAKDAQAKVDEDRDRMGRLTKLTANGKESQNEKLQRQSQLAQAQLILDQEELDDAQRDLARNGVNAQSVLQRQLAQHEKSQEHLTASAPRQAFAGTQPATGGQPDTRSLIAHASQWNAARTAGQQLTHAQDESLGRQAKLTQEHDGLERKKLPDQSAGSSVPAPAASAEARPAGAANQDAAHDATASSSEALSSVRQSSRQQQEMNDLDKRIDTEHELGDLYGRWNVLVQAREMTYLHQLIESVTWIVLIALLAVGADHLINRFSAHLTPEKTRLVTLRSVLHFCSRTLAAILVFFVIFGPPGQLATILGIAGAGLAVALKDFIVGFFGWFVLMGRHGMRRGDWVEINGVQGKVMEIGLLHTVILETGNWTDAGHPTGRKVTFVNSFPIEGHFFNFTTSGQWLWDELQVGLRGDVNPGPVVDEIRKLVVAETAQNAESAEQEWQKSTASAGLHSASGAPTVSVRPVASGLNVVVRYLARAEEREETRSRLYQSISELIVGRTRESHSAEASKAKTAF